MAKNKLGKFLAFTTGVAAVGGVCYIFRDKIRESEIYKKVTGTIADWLDKDEDFDDFEFDEDDSFDDTGLFLDSAKKNREYTSITINSSDEADDSFEFDETDEIHTSSEPEQSIEALQDSPADKTDDQMESEDDIVVNPSITNDAQIKTDATSGIVAEAYENEGLSDVSEDPDVLEEQDKLDFQSLRIFVNPTN